ncbi:Protein NUCLEAR FUSION DEFECTIVE like [Actinidia chinensis var. chinensis]|uniref:Protein NUCLEAR FUSION DEFECTIVE like n=1 Tax=Actinidia chinensis var. chinensis TaxID=1590841 RepID=A0A2R6QSU2_ACTCC|nr:Protein NUCLEAR FUSION DEFECTIVE like [Actinidia chinensis var. chinensis]
MALQWLTLVGTIWLQSINGTNSNFPAYSSQLKHLLSLSQLQLNNLAVASDVGKLFGWFSGLAAAHLPLWFVLMIGSILGLIGYGIQYLFLTNRISSLSYGHVFLLTIFSGNSICWINTVCYMVMISNFPFDRQVAVGISTSYLGISAKIYTNLVDAFFPSSPKERAKAFLLLNSTLPLVVCTFVAPMIRDINSGKSMRVEIGFVVIFVITIVTGIYAVTTSFGSMSRGMSPVTVVIGMGMLLLAPVVVPVAEKTMERLQKKCWIRRGERVHDVHVVEEVGGVEIEDGCKGGERSVGENTIGVRLMVMKVEFWLYLFVYLFGATLGLVYLNNLGQITESRGSSKASSLVSLSSSFGFFGRLVPALLAYICSRNKCMASTPVSIAAMMLPMSLAFFSLLSSTTLSLYISTAIIGFCTGAITSIAVSTTTDLFGAKNFSLNHNIVVANIPIGSFLFGDLAALIYRQQSDAKNGKCMGMGCYQTTFIMWGSLCFFGSFLALVLHSRTSK